jgi:hypothetical protein
VLFAALVRMCTKSFRVFLFSEVLFVLAFALVIVSCVFMVLAYMKKSCNDISLDLEAVMTKWPARIQQRMWDWWGEREFGWNGEKQIGVFSSLCDLYLPLYFLFSGLEILMFLLYYPIHLFLFVSKYRRGRRIELKQEKVDDPFTREVHERQQAARVKLEEALRAHQAIQMSAQEKYLMNVALLERKRIEEEKQRRDYQAKADADAKAKQEEEQKKRELEERLAWEQNREYYEPAGGYYGEEEWYEEDYGQYPDVGQEATGGPGQ